MSNLQFIKIYGDLFSRHGVYYFGGRGHRVSLDYDSKLHFPRGLDYLPGKLRLLHWQQFPMTSLPSEFHAEFLVKLCMPYSKLEKLWEGIQVTVCSLYLLLSNFHFFFLFRMDYLMYTNGFETLSHF